MAFIMYRFQKLVDDEQNMRDARDRRERRDVKLEVLGSKLRKLRTSDLKSSPVLDKPGLSA
jgi:hypothetical protein